MKGKRSKINKELFLAKGKQGIQRNTPKKIREGYLNSGFQTVARVLWGNEFSAAPILPQCNPFLPQLYIVLTILTLFFVSI